MFSKGLIGEKDLIFWILKPPESCWSDCRRRKKTGAGDSLFAGLNDTTTMPTLMKIWL